MALFSGIPDCPRQGFGQPSQRLAQIAGACAGLSGGFGRLNVALQSRNNLSAAELAELRALIGAMATDTLPQLKALVDANDDVLLNIRPKETL